MKPTTTSSARVGFTAKIKLMQAPYQFFVHGLASVWRRDNDASLSETIKGLTARNDNTALMPD